ncbi:MAG: hypothetical protein NVV60_05755 [Luteimonas sp.]|nr:hypothetical protein [Luteimonas sp.]
MPDDTVFIIGAGGFLARIAGPNAQRWSARSAEDLIAQLDADGIDRARLELVVTRPLSQPDAALDVAQENALIQVLGEAFRPSP